MEAISSLVLRKIEGYQPRGNLDHTAKLMLGMSQSNHERVHGHLERVALLTESVAIRLKMDAKAAFFAGLLHDLGKLMLPAELFCGRDISNEEYGQIKTHAIIGFEALKDLHLFVAYIAGLHHSMYLRGYGLSLADFPANWSPATIKKVLEISSIVSICDFIDANKTRKTTVLDGPSGSNLSLAQLLEEKYSDDIHIIEIALEEARHFY